MKRPVIIATFFILTNPSLAIDKVIIEYELDNPLL